ncbi:hypothetical protein [Aliiroseovarius crassostreae]|uniref:hypothetical protein n=1 Tax=Aliiroseovarius crassostreae TaxID=154981 RepID=UPI0021FBA410|nr:hypothetical protein [Aliiroseovarius crassostreae]UWQ09721.1 hypothetical protein K3X25_15140 [Aliiroseovarius crassostreae]
MHLVLNLSVVAVTTLAIGLPSFAQGYDMPPDLPGAQSEDVTQVEGTTQPVPADPYDLPPSDAATADLSPSSFSIGENATLELESRLFSNHSRDGDSSFSLRQQVHYFGSRSLGQAVSLDYNLRARADWTEGQRFQFGDDFNIDVQELALSVAFNDQTSLRLGRINLRNGVAIGFNPTDWFRDNSLVLSGSAAAADRRNERLGVVAVTGTTSIGRTLVQVGYRPKITAGRDSIWSDKDTIGLGLDRTNATEAAFVKITPDFGTNLSVTANALLLDGEPGFGVEVSGTLGDNLVLYAEAMGQRRQSLASEALANGVGSASFRAGLGADAGKNWYGQSAVGLNWALPQKWVGARDISLTFEHHYSGAGLSGAQIETLAAASGPDGTAAAALYQLANRRQDPLARQQLFARLAWNDIWSDADLSLLAYYVPADDSGLGQVALDVPITQAATLNLRAMHAFGDKMSVYGASPNKTSVQAAVLWRF